MYKEVSCAAEGHRHCRVIGKPADVRGEYDPEVVLFRTRVVPAGLPETVAGLSGQGHSARVKPQRGSSAVDRVLLAPVVDSLERLAAARFSVHPVCLAPLSARRADLPLLADARVSAIAERLRIRCPDPAAGATDVLAGAEPGFGANCGSAPWRVADIPGG